MENKRSDRRQEKPKSRKKLPLTVLAGVVVVGGAYAIPHLWSNSSDSQTTTTFNESSDSSDYIKDTDSVSPKSESEPSVTPEVAEKVTQTSTTPAMTASGSNTKSVTLVGDAEVITPALSVNPKNSSLAATRSALIDLEVMALQTTQHFSLPTSEKASVQLSDTLNRAVEVLADPDAPADRIYSTSRKLEEALDRYNGEAISNANEVKTMLAKTKSNTTNDQVGAIVLQGIAEAQNKLSADSTKDGALSAYKQFLLRESEANDRTTFRASDYTSVLKQYEANIEARTENIDEDVVEHLRSAYDTSSTALQAILGRASGKNELDAAQSGVENTYAALSEGLTLATDMKSAEPLLDSPVGKEKGQYGASSIGTLKRAIGKAERALETSTTAQQVKEARSEFEAAVSVFKSSRNS
ncbi:hypothetical protein [Saccharibacillus sp. JS10]|uniref:hypothetical protein n=1 Tax=Saccharibacillus sp. JS10 TaxID=2950552 RepID=UPI00210D09FC|nr:hypothetical protein [Saccharibacillus sp. JS10]MCQ4085936.1 hypothetical protein [Saccharibacillus sp. JS10]